jgi:FMN phosphatase YigB (HAD superfamily)
VSATTVIASNTDTAPFLKDLSRSGLEVDRWFTSEALRFYKPHPQFYRRMLAALDLRPNQAIFVGDSMRADVQGPKACGMSAIWLNRKGPSSLPAEVVVEVRGLAELPWAIARLEDSGA